MTPPDDDFELAHRLADVTSQRDRALVRLGRERDRTAELVEAVYAAAHASATQQPKVPKPAKDRRDAERLSALLHLTDWQFGKVTQSYSTEVAKQRVEHVLWEGVARHTDGVRSHTPMDHCTVMLGGDMVEGTMIFPGQPFEIDSTLFDQMFAVADSIEVCVRNALEMYREVTVVEEWGNHGRIGRKGEGPGGDNVDRMAYRVAHERLRSHERLTWESHSSFGAHVQIENYNALLVHGDEIKGYGGNIPAFGIVRKCNGWAAGAADFDFSDVYMGHYHQVMTLTLASGGQVYVTGSPESDNQYAKEFVAARGTPSQRLHIVDPAAGQVVQEHILWLE